MEDLPFARCEASEAPAEECDADFYDTESDVEDGLANTVQLCLTAFCWFDFIMGREEGLRRQIR